jgi:hypothetical protein
MTTVAGKRINATITLHGDGRADVSVFLLASDGQQTRLAVPPVPHPEAIEGFIYALAAQHGVAADAIEIIVDDQRSPFRGHQPPSGPLH